MRHARFDDVPALVTFQAGRTRQQWHTLLHDPWVTITLAEDGSGLCGWIVYTVDELRDLVLRDEHWSTDAPEELYGEGYRHWRTAATTRVRGWIQAHDERITKFLTDRGWEPTGRTRRDPADPRQILSEHAVVPPTP